MINTTINAEGRFYNHFLRNMACHFIAKKNNISFIYSFYEEIKKLGINLFVDGDNFYNLSQEQEINEENFFEYVSSSEKILKSNIKLKLRTTWIHNFQKVSFYYLIYFQYHLIDHTKMLLEYLSFYNYMRVHHVNIL